MRDQEILGLQEAYSSIYTEINEGRTTSLSALSRESEGRRNPQGAYDTDRRLAMRSQRPSAFKFKKDPETGRWSNEGRRDTNTTESEVRTKVSQRALRKKNKVPQKNGRPMFESSSDMFDYILEHLVAEGYADTNKAALAIMANMSEEWKESILDESRGAELRAKHGDNPSKKLETKAFGKAMSYDNRDRLPTGTGTEVRARYLGLSGRARSRARGETPASSAVSPDNESRTVRSRGGRARGIGAGENRDRPTG